MAANQFREVIEVLPRSVQSDFFKWLDSGQVKLSAQHHALALRLKLIVFSPTWDDYFCGNSVGIKEDYFRNIISDIFAQLKTFLADRQRLKSLEWEDYWFLCSLIDKDVPRSTFLKFYKRIESALEKKFGQGKILDEWKLKLAELNHHSLMSIQKRSKPGKKIEDQHDNAFASLSHNLRCLDQFYFFQRLRLSLELNSTLFSVGETPPETYQTFDTTNQLINKFKNGGITGGALYMDVWDLLHHDKHQYYPQLKASLPNAKLANEEKLKLIFLLQNYCSKRIAEGHGEFTDELIFWFDLRCEQGLLLVNGRLLFQELKNYITCCLKKEKPEVEKAQLFLNEFKDKIRKPFDDGALSLCEAEVYFSAENYSKVLEILPKDTITSYEDIYHRYDAKWLRLKALYKSELFDDFQKELANLKMNYYRTQNIPHNRASKHKNKLIFFDRLVNLIPTDTKAIHKLTEEINNTKLLADRDWLQRELKKKITK